MTKANARPDAPDTSRSDSIAAALSTLREIPDNTLTMSDLVDDRIGTGTDLVGDVPAGPGDTEPRRPSAYNKQRNSTWRILEEQRMHSLEVAQECDGAIKLLEAKRDDALAAMSACEIAQKTIENQP